MVRSGTVGDGRMRLGHGRKYYMLNKLTVIDIASPTVCHPSIGHRRLDGVLVASDAQRRIRQKTARDAAMTTIRKRTGALAQWFHIIKFSMHRYWNE